MNGRIGERFITNEGYEVVIVEYNNYNDLWIEFQDEYKTRKHTDCRNCQRGTIKNPYHHNKFGGYLGIIEEEVKDKLGNNYKKCYNYWMKLLERLNVEKVLEKHPTYKNCCGNEEIYNFSNFTKWFVDNYYEIEGEIMCVDKDILVKGNKEYRFDRMIFVPNRINVLFTKSDAVRGDLPIGVYYKKANNKFCCQCSILTDKGKKPKYLGLYNTPEEAFLVYKEFKEAYIKEVADEYKNRIPKCLYDAMYNWEVDIND